MPTESTKERVALAAKLKAAREYVGLSQEEVSEILKVPRSAISLIEKGDRKVDALELKQLARLYQRNVHYFTGTTEKSELPEEVAHLARAASKLKPKDLEELTLFAQFLQSKADPTDRK
jgi:transcriptional regulator with XRE-family HTH domain